MAEDKAKVGKRVKFSEHVPEVEIPEKRKPPSCDRCDTLACWPMSPPSPPRTLRKLVVGVAPKFPGKKQK